MTKSENANESQVGIAICLFITIENRSATGSRILDPIWDLEVGGIAEDGLDASEIFRILGTDRDGMCEDTLTNNQSLAWSDWPSSSLE